MADEPSPSAQVQQRVEAEVMRPFAESDGRASRFSRGRPPPRERRVRVTGAPVVDAAGHRFMTYAIDSRMRGSDAEWRTDLRGCAYTDSTSVYVQQGTLFRKASYLRGEKTDPVGGVCAAAPQS